MVGVQQPSISLSNVTEITKRTSHGLSNSEADLLIWHENGSITFQLGESAVSKTRLYVECPNCNMQYMLKDFGLTYSNGARHRRRRRFG